MAQTRSGTKAAANVNDIHQRSRGSLSENLLHRNQRSTTPRDIKSASITTDDHLFPRFIAFLISLWDAYVESDCQLKQPQLVRLGAHG
jgi:hypothetical protein